MISNSQEFKDNKYKENTSHLIIEGEIKEIGFTTFYNWTVLVKVEISNSVKAIETYSFANCSHLETISIGDNVTTIGSGAFRCCSSLVNVIIPNLVTYAKLLFFFHNEI